MCLSLFPQNVLCCVFSPSSTVQSVSAYFPKLSVICYWSMRHLCAPTSYPFSGTSRRFAVTGNTGTNITEFIKSACKRPGRRFSSSSAAVPFGGICACVHEACLTVALSLGLQTSGPVAWWQNLRWKRNPFLIQFLHSLVLQRVETTTGIILRHRAGKGFLSPVLGEFHRNLTQVVVGCLVETFSQLRVCGRFRGRASPVGCRSRHEPISVTSWRTSNWLGCLSIQREAPLERPFFVPVTATCIPFFGVARLKRRNDRDRSSTQGGGKEGCPLIQTGAGDLSPTLPPWKMAEWGPAEEGTDFSIWSITPSGTAEKKEMKDQTYCQCGLLNKRTGGGACYKQRWNKF